MGIETQWVYVKSEPGLWTVGFYDPAGKWNTDSDHDSSEAAAERVGFLNGTQSQEKLVALVEGFVEETRFIKRLGGGKLDRLIDEASALLPKEQP
jgi:hypothetical protein